ncbi:MAG TPA: glycerophosphoryl diester phosphodiesterase membrane domain-containing protein [Sphingomicrobium sp.]|nr:glycerophosphoryl diester phosphodiesterase membrane domain-containing protein [Sphingomicrobium sp.]
MGKVSISAAWEGAKQVLATDGRLLVPVALALFVLPGLVLDLAVPDAPPGKLPPAGLWIAVACLAFLVSLAGQLAVIRLAMGPAISVGEGIAHGMRRVLPYVGAVLMWMLPFVLIAGLLVSRIAADPQSPSPGASLGLLLLTAVGLFAAMRLMLASPVASAERVGPVAILARSWRLTRGNWWRMFGFFVMFLIGAFVLLIAVQAVFGLLVSLFTDVTPKSLGWFLVRIVAQLLSAMLSTIFFVMLARIYLQVSGRGEPQVSVPSSN